MFFRNRKKKQIERILKEAESFGLNNADVKEICLLINNNEYGLALDHIATQLYEYDIEITQSFFEEFLEYAKTLRIEIEEYLYLSECVRVDGEMSGLLRKEISEIIKNLQDKSPPTG